jgi:hypothetical protein
MSVVSAEAVDGRESFRAGLNMNLSHQQQVAVFMALEEACKVGVTVSSSGIKFWYTSQHEPTDLSRGLEAVDVSVYAV